MIECKKLYGISFDFDRFRTTFLEIKKKEKSERYFGSVTVNQSIERTFINALSHIQTQMCDSYFDSYGTLTVKTIVPSRSVRCLISCNCDCNLRGCAYYKINRVHPLLK